MGNRVEELKKAIRGYHESVARHAAICQRLRDQRRSASDGVMVEIDERIEVKERTIAALNRTIEATEWLIYAEERST